MTDPYQNQPNYNYQQYNDDTANQYSSQQQYDQNMYDQQPYNDPNMQGMQQQQYIQADYQAPMQPQQVYQAYDQTQVVPDPQQEMKLKGSMNNSSDEEGEKKNQTKSVRPKRTEKLFDVLGEGGHSKYRRRLLDSEDAFKKYVEENVSLLKKQVAIYILLSILLCGLTLGCFWPVTKPVDDPGFVMQPNDKDKNDWRKDD